MAELYLAREPYDDDAKAWLARSGHYLDNPPPGALFCVVARRAVPGLFGPVGGGRVGMVLVGRPVARALPQDGSVGEVTRLVCVDAPYGTPSALLRAAAEEATRRGMAAIISYHDRTKHTGCVYRKAGFRKDGVVEPKPGAWGSRTGRRSANYDAAPKRRWRLDLRTHRA